MEPYWDCFAIAAGDQEGRGAWDVPKGNEVMRDGGGAVPEQILLRAVLDSSLAEKMNVFFPSCACDMSDGHPSTLPPVHQVLFSRVACRLLSLRRGCLVCGSFISLAARRNN